MPTKPVPDQELIATLDAIERNNGSISMAAADLRLSERTVKRRRKEYYERGLHMSGGAREAIHHAGLAPTEAKAGWIKTKDPETGAGFSTYWRAPEQPPEDYLEKIRTAFEGMKPAKPIKAPKHVLDDLLTTFPVFDAHFGLHAWGRETGGDDYDTKLAADDLRMAFAKLDALTPAASEAVLLLGGDTLHADNDEGVTPRNKNPLDTDGRQFLVIEKCIAIFAEIAESLLAKHKHVTCRVLRGNHDENAHMVLTFALAERYRDNPRMTVEKDPRDLFMKQWGDCLIAAHHGDKAKPERLTLYMSDVCPFWSETRHRYMFTGHVHHDAMKDIGPLRWESLRAFCPPDAYAAGMGYASRRALQSITFHKKDGAVLRATDPIQRADK